MPVLMDFPLPPRLLQHPWTFVILHQESLSRASELHENHQDTVKLGTPDKWPCIRASKTQSYSEKVPPFNDKLSHNFRL
jgi:hypothetical protein